MKSLGACLFLSALLCVCGAVAQEGPAVSPTNLPTVEALQDLVSQLDQSTNLSGEERAEWVAHLQAAIAFAKQASKNEDSARLLLEQAQLAADTLAQLKEEASAVPDSGAVELPEETAELEAWIARQQIELKIAQDRLDAADRELERLRTRPDAIRQELDRVARGQEALASPAPATATNEVSASAAGVRRRWESAALASQSRLLRVDLDTLDARTQVALAESRVAGEKEDRLQKQVEEARARLGRLRMVQTSQVSTDAREARRLLEKASTPLKEVASRNVALAEAVALDVSDTYQINQLLAMRQGELETLRHASERVTQILGVDNLPSSYSDQLREEREKLAWIRTLERGGKDRRDQVAFKRIAQIETVQAMQDWTVADSRAQKGVYGLTTLSEEEAESLRMLLKTQRELLETRERTLDEYLRALGMLEQTELQLLKDGRAMRQMLDQQLIWTRSLPPTGPEWFREHRAAVLRALKDPTRYLGTRQDFLHLLWEHQISFAAAVLALVLGTPMASRMRRRIQELALRTDHVLTDRFAYTVETLLWSVVLASVGPLLMLFAGWTLMDAPSGELVQGAGYGLMHAAGVAFACTFVRSICRPKGLAEVHFQWPVSAHRTLHRSARVAAWTYPALVAVTMLCFWSGEEWLRNGPARISFALLLVLLAWRVHRLFRSKTGILQEWQAAASPWIQRLIPFCRFVWVGLLLSLLVGLLRGYFYTARVVLLQLSYMVLVVFNAVLVYNLALRWLRVARRRYAVAQIRKRRREDKPGEAGVQGGEGAGIQLKDLEPYDLDAINEQTHALVRLILVVTTCILFLSLLQPLLPALGVFNQIILWQGAEGDAVTLQSLFVSMIAAFLTFAAARNIPGLLEMMVLPYLPIQDSSRFAVASLIRYVIVIAGLLIVFGAVGLSWGRVQWLVAAVTVGLGFGLQEIFANFVSGIILLFEQPIRVGDIVTVDGTTGVVSRIQMRATTITDWDRKELVVPNKEFVTGRLLNWTLSDSMTRVQIVVGVAYGSDVRRALELLIQAADSNARVLKEPKPIVAFEGFEASSLKLSLRAYLPSLENRLDTVTELNLAIDESFRAAGIEIAFPQQDLHLRSVDPEAARRLVPIP